MSKRERVRALFTVKGWPEWYEWVQALQEHTGHPSIASLVEASLATAAQTSGFAEPMPPRWWMSANPAAMQDRNAAAKPTKKARKRD